MLPQSPAMYQPDESPNSPTVFKHSVFELVATHRQVKMLAPYVDDPLTHKEQLEWRAEMLNYQSMHVGNALHALASAEAPRQLDAIRMLRTQAFGLSMFTELSEEGYTPSTLARHNDNYALAHWMDVQHAELICARHGDGPGATPNLYVSEQHCMLSVEHESSRKHEREPTKENEEEKERKPIKRVRRENE